MLINCDGCHKNFPFNPEKHKHDKWIYCPWCKNQIRNPTKNLRIPKPNLNWIRQKLAKRKAKKEANKFLDRYFPKDPEGNRAFSVNSWLKGKRPRLSTEDVEVVLRRVLKRKPTTAEIAQEIEALSKLRVRVWKV